MEERLRQEIALSIKDFGLPKYEDIPDIGMFLDQVTKYISKYMEPLESITITSSMISNYVKMGLIESPIKKQYYTEQIACLIFITLAKSVLSLEDIRICMENQKQICDMRMSYEYFREEFERTLFRVFGLEDRSENAGKEEAQEKIMLRNTVITVAHKVYLDKCFSRLCKEKQDRD